MGRSSVDSCSAPKGPEPAESTLIVTPISPVVLLSIHTQQAPYPVAPTESRAIPLEKGAITGWSLPLGPVVHFPRGCLKRTPLLGVLELQQGLQVGRKERNYKALSREVESLDHKFSSLYCGRDENYGRICVQQLLPALGSLG